LDFSVSADRWHPVVELKLTQFKACRKDIHQRCPSASRMAMFHRQLEEGCGSIPAAVDDVIARGTWKDWIGLRDELARRPSLKGTIVQVCKGSEWNRCSQRHVFWPGYVASQEDAA